MLLQKIIFFFLLFSFHLLVATNCVLVDDQDKIDNLINHANKLKSLKTIISFEDTVSSDCKMKAKNIGVKIFSMFDIEILGSVLKTQIKV